MFYDKSLNVNTLCHCNNFKLLKPFPLSNYNYLFSLPLYFLRTPTFVSPLLMFTLLPLHARFVHFLPNKTVSFLRRPPIAPLLPFDVNRLNCQHQSTSAILLTPHIDLCPERWVPVRPLKVDSSKLASSLSPSLSDSHVPPKQTQHSDTPTLTLTSSTLLSQWSQLLTTSKYPLTTH